MVTAPLRPPGQHLWHHRKKTRWPTEKPLQKLGHPFLFPWYGFECQSGSAEPQWQGRLKTANPAAKSLLLAYSGNRHAHPWEPQFQHLPSRRLLRGRELRTRWRRGYDASWRRQQSLGSYVAWRHRAQKPRLSASAVAGAGLGLEQFASKPWHGEHAH